MNHETKLPVSREFLDALADPVVVTSADGEILRANLHAGRMFETPVESLQGRRIQELVALRTGRADGVRSDSIVTVVARRSGEQLPVRVSTSTIEGGNLRVQVFHVLSGEIHEISAQQPDVLGTISEGVMILNEDAKVVYLNHAGRGMLGLDDVSMPDFEARALFAHETPSSETSGIPVHFLDQTLGAAQTVAGQHALLHFPESIELEVSVNARPVHDSKSRTCGAIVSFLNITPQKHAEQQSALQKRVLDMIAAGEPILDTSAIIVDYLERVLPGTRVALYQLDRGSSDIELITAPNLPSALTKRDSQFVDDPVTAMCVETLVTRQPLIRTASAIEALSAGFSDTLTESGVCAIWCYPVVAAANGSVGVICLYREVEGCPDPEEHALIDTASGLLRIALDRVQIERELRYQSFNDDLTGLPNRVLLLDRLDIALQRAAQSDDNVALLLLNVDRFQMVNNSLGHHAGDASLREIAQRLRGSVRGDDLVARFAGDTFGILLTNIASEADAVNVVMRIQRSLASPLRATEVEIYTSASIGIAMATEPEASADMLVRYADIALNRAKEAGRGQFAIFSPAQDLSAVPRIELQSRLHRALAADALELHFQPVMSVRDRQVAGFEALVRWNDQQFGHVSPDEFLPLAQQSGIMSEITSWVLDRAVSQLRQWRGSFPNEIFCAVNISPSEMQDSLLVEQVHAVLSRYQISPSSLILEMTEHALLDTSGKPREILQRLRNLGVRIALDDFGTGYSSLSYLEHLAVDAIKIDRAFVQAARGGASRAPVAAAMVDLARQLGMLSVAEGIETEEDERVARQLGCDLSQGYYYGRPQPGSWSPPRPGVLPGD